MMKISKNIKTCQRCDYCGENDIFEKKTDTGHDWYSLVWTSKVLLRVAEAHHIQRSQVLKRAWAKQAIYFVIGVFPVDMPIDLF